MHKLLVAGGAIGLIAVAGTGLFVVRDVLAAFLFFCVFFVVAGMAVLGTFLLGEGIERCFSLLVTSAASFHLHQPIPSVGSPLLHGIGKG